MTTKKPILTSPVLTSKTFPQVFAAVFFLAMFVLGSLPGTAHSQPLNKSTALQSLRDWRTRVLALDEKSIAAQKGLISNIAKAGTVSELEAPLDEIQRLDDDRTENEARRRIVDQLIFAVDTKFAGDDLRIFLQTALLDLAVTDLSEPGQGGWWRFLIQTSVALREIAEPGVDAIKFIEDYMGESGVLSPKPAADVVKTRTYIGK